MKPYFQNDAMTIYQGDCLSVLAGLPDESVNCCVTSPPYWGLRDYGCEGQLGLEKTPDEYIAKMVAVFREVRRVLRLDGTCWVNMGDSYCSPNGRATGNTYTSSNRGIAEGTDLAQNAGIVKSWSVEMKPKDICGIPWLLAFALRADGWYLRQDIIWAKPNPMPESVTDRCTKSHEYIFLLAKSLSYYYDANAIKEPGVNPEDDLRRISKATTEGKSAPNEERNGIRKTDKQRGHSRRHAGFNDRWDAMEKSEQCSGMRNKRDVWTVSPQPFPEAHFATFPEELIKPCILAGCPAGGTVLDPFYGSGTTGLVARAQGCKVIGIELSAEYLEIAARRLAQDHFTFVG